MFDQFEVYRMMRQSNPWWNGQGGVEKLPTMYRQAYHETLDILENRELRRFVVLSGARRVGKTTVMKQVIAHLLQQGVNPQRVMYLSFDNPMYKLMGFYKVLEAYEQNVGLDEPCYFFFDEIQYAEEWSLWLKHLYDSRPNVHVVATGSASPGIEKGASDSGVGRWRVLRMPTLTFREYCDIVGAHGVSLPGRDKLKSLTEMSSVDLNGLLLGLADLQPHWARYMAMGGFPELLGMSSVERAQVVLREDVVDKVLKRDVPSLFDVRNTLQLEKIFLYLCLHSGSLINMSEMCRALEGVSMFTLQRYIDYLRDANLLYVCHNAAYTGKKGLSSQSKFYVADAAIRNASLMIDPYALSETEMGAMAENVVYKHLMYAYGGTHGLGYVRLPGRKKQEVDFAIAHPAGPRYLCEVKYKRDSSVTREDAIMTLLHAPETSGAFLVTRMPTDFGRFEEAPGGGNALIRIPAAAFCYLLG